MVRPISIRSFPDGCRRDRLALTDRLRAPVVKLVDASDSKSDSERSAGSSPARGTNFTDAG